MLKGTASRWRWVLVGWMAALAGPVLAQASAPTLAPSPALQCLTPSVAQRGEPAYPDEAWMDRRKGRVQVQARFSAPDAEPEVTVVQTEGGAAFEATVRHHLRSWRVPCLVPGQPVSLLQTYVFDPEGRQVFWSPAQDAADAERAAQLACMTQVAGERIPDYPKRALAEQVQGRVVAHMVFTAPDQPPRVTTHHRASAALLARSVRVWSQGLRLPCLRGEPIEVAQTLVFRLEGDSFGFKPPLLQQVLLSTKGIRQQTLQFDTHTMGCPFQVAFAYRQPFMPNAVGSLDQAHPAREGLLRWLRTVELELSDLMLDSIYADTTTITVPCIKLNLKPEGGP